MHDCLSALFVLSDSAGIYQNDQMHAVPTLDPTTQREGNQLRLVILDNPSLLRRGSKTNSRVRLPQARRPRCAEDRKLMASTKCTEGGGAPMVADNTARF